MLAYNKVKLNLDGRDGTTLSLTLPETGLFLTIYEVDISSFPFMDILKLDRLAKILY
jgi:hypothetical protein